MSKADGRTPPQPADVEADMAELLAAHLLETLPHLPAETIAEALRIGAELQPALARLLTRTATACAPAAQMPTVAATSSADRPSDRRPGPAGVDDAEGD